MKIKLLKDIPCYSQGSEITLLNINDTFGNKHSFKAKHLIEEGWAEEIKDEPKIEFYRKHFNLQMIQGAHTNGCDLPVTQREAEWFTSYRIVKALIDTLNGDWKSSFDSNKTNYAIEYNNSSDCFSVTGWDWTNVSIFPYCKDRETARKVIKLCGPELKILFSI